LHDRLLLSVKEQNTSTLALVDGFLDLDKCSEKSTDQRKRKNLCAPPFSLFAILKII